MSERLVQLQHRESHLRRVALVDEPYLRCLDRVASFYDLARLCLAERIGLAGHARALARGETIAHDDVYAGPSPWRLLPPIDVPDAPSKLLVAGTGLTHLGSARERQAMHLGE